MYITDDLLSALDGVLGETLGWDILVFTLQTAFNQQCSKLIRRVYPAHTWWCFEPRSPSMLSLDTTRVIFTLANIAGRRRVNINAESVPRMAFAIHSPSPREISVPRFRRVWWRRWWNTMRVHGMATKTRLDLRLFYWGSEWVSSWYAARLSNYWGGLGVTLHIHHRSVYKQPER